MSKIKILINKSFYYNPQNHIFIPLEDENEFITLATPASLCLKLLIDNQGKIISPETLISAVWVSRGMNVSTNTLYQNISILRKSIDKVGGDSHIIKTISKRGFLIDNNVEINIIEEIPEEKHTSDLIISSEIADATENAAVSAGIPKESHTLTAPANEKSGRHLYALFKKWWVWTTVPLLLVAGITTLFFMQNAKSGLESYQAFGTTGDCKLFKNRQFTNEEEFMSFIKERKISCAEKTWWYVTNYPPSTSMSIIMCQYPLNESISENNCASYYQPDSKRR